jgi:NADH:ubiquinone oxidoreductase subunit B-like Fe-S oxidoreductase
MNKLPSSPLNQDIILGNKLKNLSNKKFKKNKIFVLFCGFSCCNNELGDLLSTEYNIEKYGFYITDNPEQADVLVFSGNYKTHEQKEFLKNLYDKMQNDKFAISVGSCANGKGIYTVEVGGMFEDKDEKLIEADVYIPGCPPSAEAILYGMLKLKEQYY